MKTANQLARIEWKNVIAMTLFVTLMTFTVTPSVEATNYNWCRNLGKAVAVDRSSCIRFSGEKYTNYCNMIVYFYYCYDDQGPYSCGTPRKPTQFGGISPGRTSWPSNRNRPIWWWAFTCEVRP